MSRTSLESSIHVLSNDAIIFQMLRELNEKWGSNRLGDCKDIASDIAYFKKPNDDIKDILLYYNLYYHALNIYWISGLMSPLAER